MAKNGQWAVFVHNFTNDAVDTWVPQDWSSYEGFSLWLYGNNTGGTIFLDILDNRNPDSTTDDAERWSLDIPDNFAGGAASDRLKWPGDGRPAANAVRRS